ncbi:MAG: DUF695 domain-containing protein [Bacteroidaceae bacterium]|nr:DUF695 domain-containing protein [Bacteroidaceae bacterium]
MKLSDVWFTALSETDEGQMVVISGRDDINAFIESGKFKERAEIYWKYESSANGMPFDEEAKLMEKVQEALKQAMERDKLAIMTGVYTGGGERTWVFYTRNVPAFGEKLNQALYSFDKLPLDIYTEKDPEWEEYRDMYEMKDNEE